MKNIKTYEDFVNEEINLKKALSTGALAAGMAFSNPAISQTTNIKSNNIEMSKDETVFDFVEEDPVPVEGYKLFIEYINSNLKIPSSAIDMGISGKVFLKFIVEKDGKISNIKVEKNIEGCPECGKEGVRVLSSYPNKWKPAKNNGEFVRSYYRLPITFNYDNIKQSNNPINSISTISKDQVSNIKNYDTVKSVKIPKGFDPNNAYMKSTFLFNSNLPSVPFGGMVFIHSNDISFFIDIKSDLKWRGELGVDVNDWVEEPTQITPYSKIPMYSGSESYTQLHRYKAIDKGEVEHKRVIDIGLAKTIQVDKTLNLKAYIGCGIYNTEKELITRIHEYEWTYYHWHYIQQNDWYDYNDLGTDYIIKKEYNTKLNVTGGLLFDFASGFSMGVGFDTNPGGINLSLGFNIRK
jgi:hypothetical protein